MPLPREKGRRVAGPTDSLRSPPQVGPVRLPPRHGAVRPLAVPRAEVSAQDPVQTFPVDTPTAVAARREKEVPIHALADADRAEMFRIAPGATPPFSPKLGALRGVPPVFGAASEGRASTQVAARPQRVAARDDVVVAPGREAGDTFLPLAPDAYGRHGQTFYPAFASRQEYVP